MAIGTPAKTIQILNEAGIHLTKRLGQHFLIDQNILKKIILAAKVKSDDIVLEIGPGIGSLTEHLLATKAQVIAVEYDKKFLGILNDNFACLPNLHLIAKDAMKLALSDLPLSPNKVVSNLPYNISAPLVVKLLEEFPSIQEMVVMVQREMAMRMVAKPGSKDYGHLSLKIEFHAAAKILFGVPRTVFLPSPKVDSAVVKLTRLVKPKVHVDDYKGLFDLIGAVFGQRRKTLSNALYSAGIEKDRLSSALKMVGIDPKARGETLSLAEFVELKAALDDLTRSDE